MAEVVAVVAEAVTEALDLVHVDDNEDEDEDVHVNARATRKLVRAPALPAVLLMMSQLVHWTWILDDTQQHRHQNS